MTKVQLASQLAPTNEFSPQDRKLFEFASPVPADLLWAYLIRPESSLVSVGIADSNGNVGAVALEAPFPKIKGRKKEGKEHSAEGSAEGDTLDSFVARGRSTWSMVMEEAMSLNRDERIVQEGIKALVLDDKGKPYALPPTFRDAAREAVVERSQWALNHVMLKAAVERSAKRNNSDIVTCYFTGSKEDGPEKDISRRIEMAMPGSVAAKLLRDAVRMGIETIFTDEDLSRGRIGFRFVDHTVPEHGESLVYRASARCNFCRMPYDEGTTVTVTRGRSSHAGKEKYACIPYCHELKNIWSHAGLLRDLTEKLGSGKPLGIEIFDKGRSVKNDLSDIQAALEELDHLLPHLDGKGADPSYLWRMGRIKYDGEPVTVDTYKRMKQQLEEIQAKGKINKQQ